MRWSIPLVAVLLAGCPPKDGAPDALSDARTAPGPLETPPFEMPATETQTLSNGLKVVVASNPEVPLFEVRLVFDVGGYAEPVGSEGLAEVTFDMLNEGAGDKTAEDISRELKQLGSSLEAWADVDAATLSGSGLVRNLEPTLDLWALVLTDPTFPADDWEIMQKRYIANIALDKEDPTTIARQAAYHFLYGDSYRGRFATEETYGAITPDDMRAFYAKWVGPQNATLFVGGDVTAEQIVPLLEERLGGWAPEGVADAEPGADIEPHDGGTLYFIDKPDAAQSVLRVMSPIGTRADDDYFAFYMANQVLGGAFTARLNMNLREDKGYTYGARCFVAQWDGPGMWGCATSVQTEVTGPALTELKAEVHGLLGERPVTDDELGFFTSMEVNGFPAGYETTGAILGEQIDIWRYGLPADWPETYLPNIEAVTTDAANEAFRGRIDPDRLFWLVVGDREAVWDDLSVLGLEIVELDRDGNPLEGG